MINIIDVMHTTHCACGKRTENLRSLELHISNCKQMKIKDNSDLTPQKSQLLFLKDRLCKEAAAKVNAHLGKPSTTKRKGNNSSSPMVKAKTLCDNSATDTVDVVTSNSLLDGFPTPDEINWDFLNSESFMFSPQIWSGPYFSIGIDTE